MIDFTSYNRSLTYIRSSIPDLVPDFQHIIDMLEKYGNVDEPVVKCAEKLTIMNEYDCLDESILYLAVERNELVEFTNTAYDLFNIKSLYYSIFKSAYRTQNFTLKKISPCLPDMANAMNGIINNENIIRFCLNYGNPDQSAFLIKLFSLLCKHSPWFISDFFEMINTKPADFTWESFESWAVKGIDLLTRGRIDEGISHLKMQSMTGRHTESTSQATIHEMKNMLGIYTSSIAGKSMNIVDLDTSDYDMKTAYTDGKSVFLPPVIDFFDDKKNNERVYAALTAHQAAAIKYDTFGFDFKAIDFLDELRDRYGMELPDIVDNIKKQYGKTAVYAHKNPWSGELEVITSGNRRLRILETDHEKFFYSFPVPGLAKELFNLVENTRIENRLSMQYSGLKRDFKSLNTYIYQKRPAIKIISEDGLLPAALECLIQYALVNKWKSNYPLTRIDGLLNKITEQFDRIYDPDADIQKTAEICFRIYNIFSDYFDLTSYYSKKDMHKQFTKLQKPVISPEIIHESSPELLNNGGIPETIDSSKDKPEKAKNNAPLPQKDRITKELGAVQNNDGIKSYKYPEYDFFKDSYYENHCTLYESKLSSGSSRFYENVLFKRKLLQKKLKKRFLSLIPDELELSRRWPDGDEIHLGDAVDFAVDLKRKADAKPNIYVRRIRDVRDIVAAILVDASSSTNKALDSRSKKIIDIELEALSLLASVLSLTGDTFGIFAFNSMGRHKVLYNVIKDYDEQWNSATQGRISSVAVDAANRDGCAIRHTLSRISELPNKTKLIILLSDGKPADVKYGSGSSADTSQYAIEDARRAVMECRRKGVVPYCITIDRNAKEYIPHLYGTYNYTIIDDVSLLPERLSKLYLRLTK